MNGARILPVVFLKDASYSETTWEGDFTIMMTNQPDALFVFNDNFKDRNSRTAGAGNAVMRPFAHSPIPSAVGIPTGWTMSQPFDKLSPNVQEVIDLAFERLAHRLNVKMPDVIYYSARGFGDPIIGTSTFKIADEVAQYITRTLRSFEIRIMTPRDMEDICRRETEMESSIGPSTIDLSKNSIISSYFQPSGDMAAPRKQPMIRLHSHGSNKALVPQTHSSLVKKATTGYQPKVSPSFEMPRVDTSIRVVSVKTRDDCEKSFTRQDDAQKESGASSSSSHIGKTVAVVDAPKLALKKEGPVKRKFWEFEHTSKRPCILVPSKQVPSDDARWEKMRQDAVALMPFDPRNISLESLCKMPMHVQHLSKPKPPPAPEAELRARYGQAISDLPHPLPRRNTSRVLSVFDPFDFDAIGDILPDIACQEGSMWHSKVLLWCKHIADNQSASSS